MIRFDNVYKRYGHGHVAVDGVTLQVPQGSTTVLLGSSGSGKSTLVRMVNRMVVPDSGQVFVDGIDVATVDPVRLRRSIGYVLQEGGLFPHWTVVDNIATIPRLDNMPPAQARERAMELMELVGLDTNLAKRYPAQLSGGQRQRVGVARALANEPQVLLMDEPFGALDPLVRADLQRELRQLQHQLHTTILFVTHDVDEAFLLGDQVAVMHRGSIAQMGTPTQLLATPDSQFVADFIGATSHRRQLHTVTHAGKAIICDGDGRPVGTLDSPHS
ncbi:ABC transporter ATP-binding protein [Schaalia suimastitidis]|uniref:ABC transporter ATP-binding protein n=1 Tax=Schaalia suimastitidis TaxID=121163 RepID=UPI00040F9B2D|nr:ATP-binding cassette domain-containing protein [Schaalia suimastitidis]